MKRKLWITLTAVLIAVSVIAAFIIVPRTQKLARKTVVVGVNYDISLNNNNSGEWKGLNCDLAKELFTSLGYEVEFYEVSAADQQSALAKKQIDVYMTMQKTIDTAKFAKSDAYIEGLQVVLSTKEKNIRINTYEELSEYNCAVIDNTANVDFLSQHVPEQKILKFADITALFTALDSGVADLVIIDYYYASRLLKSADGGKYVQGVNAEACPWTFVFRNDETELLSKTNEKIKEYKKERYIYDIRDKNNLTQYFY